MVFKISNKLDGSACKSIKFQELDLYIHMYIYFFRFNDPVSTTYVKSSMVNEYYPYNSSDAGLIPSLQC